MYRKLSEVDNPGRGNCAFYAFGLGILPHLKQELESCDNLEGTKLNKLLALLNESEKAIFRDQLRKFDIQRIDLDLLWNIHVVLRKMLYEVRIRSLDGEFRDEYQVEKGQKKELTHFHLKDNILFSEAIQVFTYFYNNQQDKALIENNEFYINDELRNALNDLAKYVTELEASGVILEDFQKANYVRAVFVDQNEKDSPNQKFSTNSLAAKLIKDKLYSGVWGNENDLNVLAEELGFFLAIHIKRQPVCSPQSDGRPIVNVNQPNSSHWTTLFTEGYQPESISRLTKSKKQAPYFKKHPQTVNPSGDRFNILTKQQPSICMFGADLKKITTSQPVVRDNEPENKEDTEILALIKDTEAFMQKHEIPLLGSKTKRR